VATAPQHHGRSDAKEAARDVEFLALNLIAVDPQRERGEKLIPLARLLAP